jgi:hypothetical protein
VRLNLNFSSLASVVATEIFLKLHVELQLRFLFTVESWLQPGFLSVASEDATEIFIRYKCVYN